MSGIEQSASGATCLTDVSKQAKAQVGMVGSEGDREVAKETERSRTVNGSRSNRTRVEVEAVVGDLIARYGSFPASAVSERTVRRCLANMVREGRLVSVPRGQVDDLSRRHLG